MDKRGMEMWEIVLALIIIILLIVMIVWYGDLGSKLGNLFSKAGSLF